MNLSVRVRLTLVVVIITAGAAVVALLWGTSRMEASLVDEATDDAFNDIEDFLEFTTATLADIAPLPGSGIVVSGTEEDPVFAELIAGGDFVLTSEVPSAAIALSEIVRAEETGGLFEALGVSRGDPVAILFGDNQVRMVTPDPQGRTRATEAPADAVAVPYWDVMDLGFEVDPAFDTAGPLNYVTREIDGRSYALPVFTEDITRSVDRIRSGLWLAVLALAALAAAATWFLVGRILRPVQLITDRASEITAGTMHERVPVPHTRDEIYDLATTMNGMLDRLEVSDHRRRQFVSDASHELRTPVAILRSEAEVALRRPEAVETEELASSVLAESDRLTTLVEDLLSLARHDEMQDRVPVWPIDLDDLVLTEAARPRRLPINQRAVSAGRVMGRAEDLRRVIAHLLDNAVRHGRDQVAVGLETTDGRVVLHIDDDGDGVAEADRTRVFDRFARLEAARTRDRGGAGLGLAVVSATVAELDGQIEVGDSPLGGARFTITLPQAPT